MHPGLLAFASGGFLYIASAAVGSLPGASEIKGLAWLGVVAVALCHAGLGFFAIGDLRPDLPSTGMVVGQVVASLLMTALALVAAIAAASLFPLSIRPDVALTLVAVSVLASAVSLTLTVGRSRRAGP